MLNKSKYIFVNESTGSEVKSFIGQPNLNFGNIKKGLRIFVLDPQEDFNFKEISRSEKRQEANELRKSLVEAPIAYNGELFDSDSLSREALSRTQRTLERTPEITFVNWTTAEGSENSEVPLAPLDIETIDDLITLRGNELFTVFRLVKAEIEASETPWSINVQELYDLKKTEV